MANANWYGQFSRCPFTRINKQLYEISSLQTHTDRLKPCVHTLAPVVASIRILDALQMLYYSLGITH
jgi:hypothetical protein